MFGLLTRKNTPRSAAPRHARLQLEHLESRNVPSVMTLNINYDTGKTVTLTGTLSGSANGSPQVDTYSGPANASNQTITFSGPVNGTTTTNSDGTFVFTGVANTLGVITAQAPDSTIATVGVSSTAPTVEKFAAAEGLGRIWHFFGDVSYVHNPNTVILNFAGAPVTLHGQSTTANAAGHFDLWLQLNGTRTDNGGFSVYPVDAWGLEGADYNYFITQTGT